MKAGEVLFQDDVEKSPAKKTPKHWSGNVLPACCSLTQSVESQIPGYLLDLHPPEPSTTRQRFSAQRYIVAPVYEGHEKKSGLHNFKKLLMFAAVVGDQPCQQMVVQVGNRKPQVDKPGVL